MLQDTKIGGADSKFPLTRWSAIKALSSEDAEQRRIAFDRIVEAYWRPVYKYIRLKWGKSNEDAKDLTQAFFATVIEKDFFSNYDRDKARFRTFLRKCLDGYAANEEKAARRLKRGGSHRFVSLDYDSVDDELRIDPPSQEATAEEVFDREWTRTLFELAVDALKSSLNESGKDIHFNLFERYDLASSTDVQRVTYDELAKEYDLPVTQVTNYLALARREFRTVLLNKLREVTLTDEEFREEARHLLGIKL